MSEIERSLTILMQKVIVADSEDDYEERRDAITEELEGYGWSVNIEDESDV